MRHSFLFVLMAATSCTSIYLPNVQNVPTFKGAKEFQGNAQAQIFLPPFAYSFQTQAAYSLTSHIGVMANYAYSRTTTKGSGHLGEFGVGYYVNLPKNYFGVFLGYGNSSASDVTNNFAFYLFGNPNPTAVSRENATRLTSRYTSWFLQPSYAFNLNRISLVFSMKASRIDFENAYYGNNFTLLQTNTASFHFEPAGTIKVNLGNGPFNFIGQVGIHLTNDNDTQLITNFARIAIGLQWSPSKKRD